MQFDMKNIIQKILRFKWYALALVVVAVGITAYIVTRGSSTEAASFYVVDSVERGEVTSGIQTTGDIIAEQKLDIDVYKRLSRIDAVNVANGSHVDAGDVLVSFDKNDAYVDTQSSRVAVAEAELSLQEEQESAGDPSTQIRTKENQIAEYEKSLVDAFRNFLNTNLEAAIGKGRESFQKGKSVPKISGRYVSDVQGEYLVEVYSSLAESGYSFRISGLESGTGSVFQNKEVSFGSRGLKITFPDDVSGGDKWIVRVPNTEIALYEESKTEYERTKADLKVSLENAEQELAALQRGDTEAYRNLGVEKAQASLAEARQRLSQNYDIVQERDIVAPFAGTVEGMENVVVGATPTGGTSDTINLGTLISDEFLTTFTLGAADVGKVKVGQKVKVTVTSFSEQPVFEASVTQISSLPSSEGVAQYEVQARLDYDRTTAELVLREGMLADIEVVQEEKPDVLRVPTSAVKYVQGVPKVTVVDKLTEEQQAQAERMGIVRTEGTDVSTYEVEVQLGITGQYYVEITGGLSEGDIIVVSSLANTEEDSQEATTRGFAPPGGAMIRQSGSGQNRGQQSGQSGNNARAN